MTHPYPTTLPAFTAAFGTEAKCREYLTRLRWPDGFECPRCGAAAQGYHAERKLWRCRNGHDVSLTAGTALHRSKQSLRTWFYAAWLAVTYKPGISAVQFQRQLGLTRYETAWMMLHKLRAALVAPDRQPLHDVITDDNHASRWVEIDEFYIGGKEEGEKRRGRGAKTKRLCVVAVEAIELRKPEKTEESGPRTKRIRKAGRIRLKVIPDATAKTLTGWIRRNVAKGTAIVTDTHGGYLPLRRLGYVHEPIVAKETDDPLPLAGIVITNLKRWLAGTHKHAVRGQHLQTYLNEFAFRFNRRNNLWLAWQTALGLAALSRDRPTYRGLYDHTWTHRNPRLAPEYEVAEVQLELDLEDALESA